MAPTGGNKETRTRTDGAAFVGFRVSGDSATPLPVGILVQDSSFSIIDVEITGATRAAVEVAGTGTSALMASDIRDNAGSALVVREGHAPRVSHNTFARNGKSDRGSAIAVQLVIGEDGKVVGPPIGKLEKPHPAFVTSL